MNKILGWSCFTTLSASLALAGGCSDQAGAPATRAANPNGGTVSTMSAVTLPSAADRNALASSLSPLLESSSVIDAITSAQSSKQLTPFESALLGTFPSLRRLIALYGKQSLTPAEASEATELLASVTANAAVKKWVELSQSAPAKCSDLAQAAKNAPMPSEAQARAFAPKAEKILNQCLAGNAAVPGVWAGLFQEDALSSVLLDNEVLVRSTSVAEGIVGGIALVGGVVLAVASAGTLSGVGVAVAVFGAGLIATAVGKKDNSCLDCGTNTDGTGFNCGTGCKIGSGSSALTDANGCITGAPACGAGVACPTGTLCAYGCCELGTTGLVATTSTTAQYTVTLTFPGNLLPNQIALWAAEGVFVNDRVHVLKEDSSGAPVVEVVAGGSSRVGVDAVTGTVMTGGPVAVSDRAIIEGDLFAGGGVSFQDRQTNQITGTVLENAAAVQATPARTFMGWLVTFQTTGLSDVSLEPNTTRELAEGDYRNLVVKSGATLVLDEGTYHFESIDIEAGANVLVHGTLASVLNVRSSIILRGTVSQLDSSTSTLSVIYVGTSALVANQTYRGTLIAPFADINLDIANLAMLASVWGKTITVHQGGFITLPTHNSWDVFTAALTQ